MVEAHHGQRRSSGEEYYNHPLSVAKILVGLGMDSESLAAALLHDVVEDTDVTEAELKEEFGEHVAMMVDGVTKLGKLPLSTTEQQQAENLRKMLIAMAKDIRVIIIKLADRLHNMRTIDAMSEQHQRDKALETLDIYAPIAHRLGIRAVKEELEDLAIKHLDPIGYAEIEELLATRKQEREAVLKDICDRIKEHLAKVMPGIKIVIEGRVKSIHGIYRKMFVAGKDFDEIYDVYAVRIITDTLTDCYNILGIMHDMYQPLPGRFKDYISTPKPNMYQSLHTTLIGSEKIPFEVQIRTFEMHHTAEYGIAAHWKYKEGIDKNDRNLEDRLAWVRQILEAQKESDNPEEIVQSIKTDLSLDDVFAVTPKGDVISLPSGSTVIDFAFAIHSAVGIKMVGAKANGKIVPLNHPIQTGEVIEIITTNQTGHGPSRDWLNFARTTSAKQKIRSWFKKERRPENIETGRNQIERDFHRNNIRLSEEEMAEFIEKTAARQHFNTVDDFYAAIGYGGVVLSKIMPRIKEEYQRILKERNETVKLAPQQNVSHTSNGITVEGIDNCLVKLSKCCTPLPGDEIIGFITRGHGVSIHKRDCNNVPKDIENCAEPERWVKAYFENTGNSAFKASLMITGNDRMSFLSDVVGTLAQMSVPVHSVNARQIIGGSALINVTVSVQNVNQITTITQKLKKIEGVFGVERIKG
ncbi:MAG: bifunctional (p)ppGpp synthetase/guanosine-3',5'-bis(diphosphate) 3'-pyrophosphohydrolase [Oscillospiraceae bacterium]|nr:bifunctional (p)ppGpp synthetase/guanosine-3',5'-bis(diphosphate) 3'-pyrophosphohydrolase [Candidatus Equicaccousia limihippi]